jgi:ApeA N-terminal domain 1
MDFFDRKLPIEIRGRFWFADEPQTTVQGKLVVSAGHLYDLEIEVPKEKVNIGPFAERNLGSQYEAIVGEDNDGVKISLLKCVSLGSQIAYSAPQTIQRQTARFFSQCVIFGAHIANLETARFNAFSAFFTDFTEWAGGIEAEVWENFVPPLKPRVYEIEDFGKLEIQCVGLNRSYSSDFEERRQIRYLEPLFKPVKSSH